VRNLFVFLLIAASSRAAEIKINFSEYPPGAAPTNFTSARAGTGADGDWKIMADEAPNTFSAPLMPQVAATPSAAKRSVLAQLSGDPTDERFPLLVYDGVIVKNFKLTTQFKLVAGAAEQMAGIVFRYQNPSNFYVLRASALGRNLRFYKVINGQRGNLIGPEIDITTNTWHTLGIQCEGDQIEFSLDGRPGMAALHDTSLSTGKIGFWTKSDSVSYFGDTVVNYTPIIPGAQTLLQRTLKQYPRIAGLQIFMTDGKGEPQIVASKDEAEVGRAGGDTEKKTLESGAVFYGHEKGFVSAMYPLNDRNGEPVAAVRVRLKSYSFAETQDMVLDRVRIIINEMQKGVFSKDDLR